MATISKYRQIKSKAKQKRTERQALTFLWHGPKQEKSRDVRLSTFPDGSSIGINNGTRI